MAFCQHRQAANVVAMLMREKNRLHVAHRPADGGKTQLDLLRAEAGIDQDADMVGLEIGAVAAAPAA